jgi:hypothetical protein
VPESVLALAQAWSPRFRSGLHLDVAPLIAFNPTGTHLLAFNTSLQAAFVAAAAAEARLVGYSGYNIDAELPGAFVEYMPATLTQPSCAPTLCAR